MGPIVAGVDLPLDTDDLRRTLRAHGVVFALVFGSRAAGTPRTGSDVDLAVWSKGAIDVWRLRGALPDTVDLLDLMAASEGLAGRVAMTGQVVLDDDPRERIRWQAQTRKRYLDETSRRRRFQADFVRAHG